MATTDPFGEDSYAQVKMEPTEDEEFLYGKKDEVQAPEVKGEDPFESSMQPPSDSIPQETEEPPEDDYEDDDEEEGVQIVLNTEAINSPDASASGAGTGAFPKRPLFSRPQPNQQRPGSTPIPNYQAQRGQPNAQMVQSPIVGQPPGSKSAFDIDIDGLEEKPWRKPGADITDFFNYGFNEETWKGYCVPEEHEILTNRGFLDLDAYQAAVAADPTLLVASYNVTTKALVFEAPNQLVQFAAATRELVELSNANEMLHVWSADSDSHGIAQRGLKVGHSNGVSMLVTKEHDVFAQLGNASVEKNGELKPRARTVMPDGSKKQAPAPPAKYEAGGLLNSQKEYNSVRQLAVAEAGVQGETVPDFCDELNLRTPEQRALFYEIYGFWLGDGTLYWYGQLQGFVVRFSQVKEADITWLEATLKTLGVPYTKGNPSPVGQVKISIKSNAWNRVFAAEYKHKYKQPGATADNEDADDEDADDEGVEDEGADDEGADPVAKRTKTDAAHALSNLKKFASFSKVTDRRTAAALHLQRVRDAVELTNDAIVAPPARAAAVASFDAEGRAFDTVSTAKGSYMQPEGIKSAKWFAYWVWRLGAASLRRVLAGLHRADGCIANRTIWTSSARFRDEIQRVCLMAGYTALFRCVYKAGAQRGVVQGGHIVSTVPSWAVYFAESDGSPEGEKASKPNLFKARGEIRARQYTGRVWCFNMPSGFIWVRRVTKDDAGVVTKASRPLITGNCQKQVTLRLEQSMQGKIKVYSSEQGASDMPAELLALTGGDSKSRSKQDRPSSSSIKREGSSKSTSGPPGDWSRLPDHSRRRQREQDDSVIQVLASGDDRSEERDRDRERSPRSGSPGSPRGPPFPMGLPMGRFPIPIPGMPPRGPPPYDRDFRRRSRSPPRYRDDRGPPDRDPRYRDEFRDPRDRRREERPRDPRDERPREERPKEREERREERSRDKERDESKRPKREESEDRAKRSRH